MAIKKTCTVLYTLLYFTLISLEGPIPALSRIRKHRVVLSLVRGILNISLCSVYFFGILWFSFGKLIRDPFGKYLQTEGSVLSKRIILLIQCARNSPEAKTEKS